MKLADDEKAYLRLSKELHKVHWRVLRPIVYPLGYERVAKEEAEDERGRYTKIIGEAKRLVYKEISAYQRMQDSRGELGLSESPLWKKRLYDDIMELYLLGGEKATLPKDMDPVNWGEMDACRNKLLSYCRHEL